MKKLTGFGAALAGASVLAVGLISQTVNAADDEQHLPAIVGDTQLITRAPAPEGHPLMEVMSGFEFRTKETQALQLDDFTNPGMLAVERGQESWDTVDGSAGKSCASCHNDASESMKGLRAVMPKWNEAAGRPLTMEQTINQCRTDRMGAEAWKWNSDPMVSMTALIGLQSRGMPVAINIEEGDMKSWWDRGQEMYYTRTGQLDLSCANCHEDNSDNYIRADHLSQGQINGFPTYRLKTQSLNSVHKRFFGCVRDTRATPYKVGSDELVALEIYVAWRGLGLSIEAPSVRN